MSHYLVDIHSPSFPASKIIDVVEAPSGSSLTNGGAVIRVPDYIQVQDPTDTLDLVAKKYTGFLAYYAGFSYVTYDALLDTVGINLADPSIKGVFGERGVISLPGTADGGGNFNSTLVTLGGAPPTQAVILWEAYSITVDDLASTRLHRTYNEEPASDVRCDVSFDNGVNWNTVSEGVVFNIPLIAQGVDFLIRFINLSADRRYIGSWALIT